MLIGQWRYSRNWSITPWTPPNVVDIGVRLADVQAMNLPAELVEYRQKGDPRPSLMDCGATEEETAFLVSHQRSDGRWLGQCVELNAMTSEGFIKWLERKLQEQGVTKFIPTDRQLRIAWTRAWCIRQINVALAKTVRELGKPPAPPPGLTDQIQRYLEEHPAAAWDTALSATEVQS